jgi:hypothetical protein
MTIVVGKINFAQGIAKSNASPGNYHPRHVLSNEILFKDDYFCNYENERIPGVCNGNTTIISK